jgi:exopolysaccharide production protein ExoQ
MNSRISIADRATSAKPTGAVPCFAVGFFFSFRIVISLFSVRVLGTDARTGAELGLALNVLLLLVVAFCSLGEVRHTFGSMLRLWSIRWVLLFILFSGCSLIWSSTESLPAAVGYWCGLVGDVAIVVLLLRANPVTDVAIALMKGFVWSSCCLALVAWVMPAQSDLRLGDEDFFNANQIGYVCAFAFFLAQYLLRSKAGNWFFAAFFLGVTLLRTLSKTTIVAFLLSESFLLIHDRSIQRRTKLLLTFAVAVVVLVFWGLLESYYDVYTHAGNQAETLTGRIGIWAYMLEAALEQPWIGHGFDSVWKVVPPFGDFEAWHAENELLQQFYAYGVVGICLLAGLYGSLYYQFRRLSRGPLKIFFVSMLLFIVVRGCAEAEPFDLLLPLWSIVVISPLAEHIRKEGIDTSFASQQIAPAAVPPSLRSAKAFHVPILSVNQDTLLWVLTDTHVH